MRDLRRGKISQAEFVRRLEPYAVHEVGGVAKLDTGRHARTGAAEAVLAEGKDDTVLASVVRAAAAPLAFPEGPFRRRIAYFRLYLVFRQNSFSIKCFASRPALR